MTRLLVSYVSISRPIPVFLSTSVDQWPARRRTNQTYKKCVSNQWQISATRPPPSEEGVQIFRNRPCPHTARSKSSHARRARASSVTRTIFIITPSSSVAKCHDSTAPIVFTERNTCPTFAPTSVESIPVTTSTPLTFVKFRTDE